MFYKLEDDIVIFIQVKGEFSHGKSAILTCVFPMPYCVEFGSEEYFDLDGPMHDNMFEMLKRIMPDKFTPEYYFNLISADSEEGTLNSLDSICEIMKELIVPYVQKFADLEFFYSELPLLRMLPNDKTNPYANEEMFGVSIKLRKYETAMFYVDWRMSIFKSRLERAESELKMLRSGELSGFLLSFKIHNPKKYEKAFERRIRAAERALPEYKKGIAEWQIMKDALLAHDHVFLDSYISKIELNSRKNVKEMLKLEM